MSETVTYPHLTIDPDGTARIGVTRYKVRHLAAEHYQYGWPAEELLRQHPDLRPEQVYAALTYFYDHHEQMIVEMHSAAEALEEQRRAQILTRAELLKRQTRDGAR